MAKTLLFDPDVTGFGDQKLAMVGVDGRWRTLSMDQFDLDPDAYYGPDTGWAGSLSPNGRWWMFPENGAPGNGRRWTVFDLRSGARRSYDPDRGQTIFPIWTAESQLVFTRARPDRARTVIDPDTGTTTSTRALPGNAQANLVYGPGGCCHRIDLKGKPGVETYDDGMRRVSRVEAPFDFPDGPFAPMAAVTDKFAFLREQEAKVLVTDAELRPLHELRAPSRLPWGAVAWIDSDTVLLWNPSRYGGDPDSPVVAWKPAIGEVSVLSSLVAPQLAEDALVPDFAPNAISVE